MSFPSQKCTRNAQYCPLRGSVAGNLCRILCVNKSTSRGGGKRGTGKLRQSSHWNYFINCSKYSSATRIGLTFFSYLNETQFARGWWVLDVDRAWQVENSLEGCWNFKKISFSFFLLFFFFLKCVPVIIISSFTCWNEVWWVFLGQ